MPISTRLARPSFRGLRNLVLAATVLTAFSGAALADPEFVKQAKPGAGLYELVYSAPLNRVYVAATGPRGSKEAAVLALDPATLDVKETIALGEDGVFGLAVNNKTKTLYGTQTRTGSVAAIDIASGKVVGTVAKGEKAHVRQVVIDEDANKVYVSAVGMRGAPSEIWIIDGATNKLDHAIEGLEGGVTGLALDTKGKRLFASAMNSNEVLVIDLATEKVTKTFPSEGENAINLVYDAGGNQLFVAHQGSGEVSVLDADDGKLVKKIPTGEGALALAIDPQRGIVYVTNRRAGFVTLIDAKTLEPIANITTGSMPQTVTVDVESGNAYVSNKVKSAGRPRPAAPPPAAAPAGGAPAPQAAATAPAPAAAPAGERPRPVPMVDVFGDTVTLIRP